MLSRVTGHLIRLKKKKTSKDRYTFLLVEWPYSTMEQTELHSYIYSQCGDDMVSLGRRFSRLKSRARAEGSLIPINGHAFRS